MEKIKINNSKTLKLVHTLERKLTDQELFQMDKILEQMENYILVKQSKPMGPLIQYANAYMLPDGTQQVDIRLIRQMSSPIENTDKQYEYQAERKIANCLYGSYAGEQKNLNYVYNKMMVTAFEEDISLVGDSYTIFIKGDEDDFAVDVFMEVAK